jgi:hypothetical protein
MSKSPLIWFSDAIKFLRNKISFSNQVSIEAGSADPSSSATDGLEGSLYLSTSEKNLFIKQDNGSSTNWSLLGGGGGGGGQLLNIDVFTTSDTYVKNPSASYIIVETVGGGGGSGGAPTCTGSANRRACGTGGGGGEYGYKVIQNENINGAGEVVTIGAGGDAGAAGAAGGTGGTTSFGTHITSVGGGGGNPISSDGAYGAGGIGGTGGVGGDMYIAGSDASNNKAGATTPRYPLLNACGGDSYLSGRVRSPTVYPTIGTVGKLYGGGASGTINGNTEAAKVGAAGAPGIVIVREYS